MVDTIEELNKLMDEDVARMANNLGLPEGSSANAVSCELMRLERVEKDDLPADASWGDIGAAQADISNAREKDREKKRRPFQLRYG